MQKLILEAGGVQSPYETMSIGSKGGSPVLIDQKRAKRPYAIKNTNQVRDIEGTYSFNKYDQWGVKDLVKVVPARRDVTTRNAPDTQLMLDDIPGTRFLARSGMERTTRHLSPLNPAYPLPSFVLPLPQVDRRPIRDVLQTSDIAGAQSSSYDLQRLKTRDVLCIHDIPGAASRQHFTGDGRLSPQQQQYLGQHDDGKQLRFQDRTQRHTNALEPQYQYNGMVIADESTYTKPCPAKRFIPQGTFSLATQDIPGATTGSLSRQRREIRNILLTADVVGAQADTVKKTVQTTRRTCPLSPTYQSLDWGAPLPPVVSPLIDPLQLSMIPSLRFLKDRGNALESLASPIAVHPSNIG